MFPFHFASLLIRCRPDAGGDSNEKPTFQGCLRAVGSLTSPQRHASSCGDRVERQEKSGGRGGFPGGNPHRLSSLSPPGDPTMGPCVRAPAISVPHGCKRTFGPLMAHRAVNPRKGIRVLARCLPYPECERLPFAPERVEASLPWSCNKLPGPLSRMETDDRRVC